MKYAAVVALALAVALGTGGLGIGGLGIGKLGAAEQRVLPGLPPGPPALAGLDETWRSTPDEQRDPAEMERSLERLLEQAEASGKVADQVVLLTYISLVRSFAQDLDGALAPLDRAVALGPSYWFPTVIRGETLGRLGRHRDALADFDRALAVLPRDASATEPAIRIARAAGLKNLRRFGEAAEEYRRVLDFAPNNLDLAYERAIMHSLAGQKAVALRQIDDLLQREPGNLILLRDRAEILMGLGRYLDARRALDEALAVDAGDPRTLRVRGRLAFLQGDFTQATRYYAESFDQDLARGLPDPYTLVRLATARLRAGEPDPTDSRRRQGLAPQDPWTAALLAHLLDETSAEALLARARDSEDALQRDGRLAEAQYVIGQKLLAEGRKAEAKRAFEAVVALELTYFVENFMAKAELERLP